ncbi:MAG: hypothetical protein ACKERG_01770 [Candidatus Hodgkinia cicadicola]
MLRCWWSRYLSKGGSPSPEVSKWESGRSVWPGVSGEWWERKDVKIKDWETRGEAWGGMMMMWE